MSKNKKRAELACLAAGLIFTSVLGTLSHFFWEWSDRSTLIALISPVNESTWEHMKLLFFPALLWSFLLPPAVRKTFPSMRAAVQLGGIAGTLCIPVLFYTYSGILGRTVTAADIAVFYISVIFAFTAAAKLNSANRIFDRQNAVYFLSALFAALFFFFTFNPPNIGIFQIP